MVPVVEQQIKKVFNWKRNVAMDRTKKKLNCEDLKYFIIKIIIWKTEHKSDSNM